MPPSEISSTGRRPNRSLSAPRNGAHRNCISENAASRMPIQTEAAGGREVAELHDQARHDGHDDAETERVDRDGRQHEPHGSGASAGCQQSAISCREWQTTQLMDDAALYTSAASPA